MHQVQSQSTAKTAVQARPSRHAVAAAATAAAAAHHKAVKCRQAASGAASCPTPGARADHRRERRQRRRGVLAALLLLQRHADFATRLEDGHWHAAGLRRRAGLRRWHAWAGRREGGRVWVHEGVLGPGSSRRCVRQTRVSGMLSSSAPAGDGAWSLACVASSARRGAVVASQVARAPAPAAQDHDHNQAARRRAGGRPRRQAGAGNNDAGDSPDQLPLLPPSYLTKAQSAMPT